MTGQRFRERGPGACPATRDITPKGLGLDPGLVVLACDRPAKHTGSHHRHQLDGRLDYDWSGPVDPVPATRGAAA